MLFLNENGFHLLLPQGREMPRELILALRPAERHHDQFEFLTWCTVMKYECMQFNTKILVCMNDNWCLYFFSSYN